MLLQEAPASAASSLVKTARIMAFARSARDAAYWGERTQGLDFSRSDHADKARFNRVLWAGLKGEAEPCPVARSGRNLRAHRQRLLADAAKKKGPLFAKGRTDGSFLAR
jgi:hypothetical protein